MSETCTQTTTIRNAQGLHLRPMNAFTALASTFESTVQISVDTRGPADGKSVLSLLGLAAACGESITIEAAGPDAAAAVAGLVALVDDYFGLGAGD